MNTLAPWIYSLPFFFFSPSVIKFHMCRPIFTDSESVLSLWSFFFSVCRFLLILCQYDIVRCAHLLFLPHLSFLYCSLFLLFFKDTGISRFLCLYTIQFTQEILPSFCDFILSFLALIFAFPPVLKTPKQNNCDIFLSPTCFLMHHHR